MTSVVHTLRDRAARDPSAPLFSFYDAGGELAGTRSMGQCWEGAESVGRALLATGLQPADHVLLVYPPGLAFVDAFVGCLRSGLVPVPLPPPTPGGLNGFVEVTRDCDARAVLSGNTLATSRGFRRAWDALQSHPRWPGVPWHNTEVILGETELPLLPRAEALAFLQYTSGSTSSPRGVRITHANLVHQLDSNTAELHFDASCRSVTWVPHYHDFALISGILGSMAGHGHLILIDPQAFLRRPALWGELISQHRATHAWAPDFGYSLFVARTRPDERQQWDFGNLRVLMTAAEPIRAATVDAFLEAFEVTGLPRNAFCPAYGLAEHSVAVSVFGRRRNKFSRTALEEEGVLRVAVGQEPFSELFGCGPPGPDVQLRVVDPQRCREVLGGHVGEIWLDSPSKADGYHNQPEVSAAVFEATLEGEDGAWLRTGDLGAMFDRELFITGRLKDLILLRGRNVAPQDVEAAICERPEFRTGRAVAFGADIEGEERLIVVAELRQSEPDSEHLEACMRAAVGALQEALALVPHRVVLCPAQTIPKTTSGKVQRQLCRKRWLAGALTHYGAAE